MRVEKVKHVRKSLLVCDTISIATTFTREACHEIFKVQSGYLN